MVEDANQEILSQGAKKHHCEENYMRQLFLQVTNRTQKTLIFMGLGLERKLPYSLLDIKKHKGISNTQRKMLKKDKKLTTAASAAVHFILMVIFLQN